MEKNHALYAHRTYTKLAKLAKCILTLTNEPPMSSNYEHIDKTFDFLTTNYETEVNTSDVEQVKSFRKQNLEVEVNNMQMADFDKRLLNEKTWIVNN